MAVPIILLALAGVPVAFVCIIIYNIIRNETLQYKDGCQPPPFGSYSNKLIWRYNGFIQAYKAFEAIKNHRLPNFIEEQCRIMNIYTSRAYLLGAPMVMTMEPKNIQAVLATQFKDFGLQESRHGNFAPLLGTGIFTTDGKAWETSRALLRPQFTRDNINDLPAVERHLQKVIARLPTSSMKAVDIQDLFFKFTVDSATEFLFGRSADTLNTEPPKSQQEVVARDFESGFIHAQEFIAERFPMGRNYWLRQSSEFNRNCAKVDAFARDCVRDAVQRVRVNGGKPRADGKYVFAEQLALQNLSEATIRDQLLHILLAGRDTTAATLSFLFFKLARNKRVFNKLRAEVLETFGYGNSQLNFASIKDCVYLRYVLNETLRLYPTVSINGRTALRDTTLPVGGGPDGKSPIFVSKGTRVDWSIYVVQRREDIYGPDAAEFRPERWSEKGAGRGWEYLPFNGGPRICLGQQYALTEAGYVVIRLLQKYSSVDPVETHLEEPALVNQLTMSIWGGCNVYLTEDPESRGRL